MPHYIFARVENQIVRFVGCSKTDKIPEDSILLQTVERNPEVHWVKWCLRFASTLTDKTGLTHRYAKFFKNSARTRRLLGDADFEFVLQQENAAFLQFHEKNPHLLKLLIEAALEKKEAARKEFSIGQLLGEARWSDTEIDRGEERLKINDHWCAWYSRAIQMVEPGLIGFFTLRASIADGLVWIDGRSWSDFAAKHDDKIRWDEFSQFPDTDWEYTE